MQERLIEVSPFSEVGHEEVGLSGALEVSEPLAVGQARLAGQLALELGSLLPESQGLQALVDAQ